jgi:hypothetical protein
MRKLFPYMKEHFEDNTSVLSTTGEENPLIKEDIHFILKVMDSSIIRKVAKSLSEVWYDRNDEKNNQENTKQIMEYLKKVKQFA